jgi:23S rRNA pseudouridine1911/1915/1917 synthase
MARHALRAGSRVEVLLGAPEARPAVGTNDIVLDTEHFLVANKPPLRLTNGPGSLEAELRRVTGLEALTAVHRLDRDTSGCVLMAKSHLAFDRAVELFRSRRVRKVYRAIAAGCVRPAQRTIAIPLEHHRAVTHVRVLAAQEQASHLELTIETGRTHQIRKHLAAVGHPVVGDRDYGTVAPRPALQRQVPRQMLHALRIALVCPLSGQPIRAEAPLPEDFRQCLRRLGLG